MDAPEIPDDESCSSTLFIRHLPSSLNSDDKTSLLKHFGATHVRVMGNKGKMKNTAFAIFLSSELAKKALNRLHQLEVEGLKLSVEFSKKRFQGLHPKVTEEYGVKDDPKKDPKPKVDSKKSDAALQKSVAEEINRFSSQWGMEYPINPKLKYCYPPPSMTILTNIANALASVPKFYVQVLHLMNKMNLPTPFGPVTATPPLAEDINNEPSDVKMKDMEVSSSEESEIESEEDEKIQPEEIVPKLPKKRKAKNPVNIAPKFKLQKISETVPRAPGIVHKAEEAFEQAPGKLKKNFELKIPSTVRAATTKDDETVPSSEEKSSVENVSESKHSVVNCFEDIVKKCKQIDIAADELIVEILNVVEKHYEEEGDRKSDKNDDEKTVQSALILLKKYQETVPESKTIIADLEEVIQASNKQEEVEVSGFGKIEPVAKDTKNEDKESDGEIEEWGSGEFISSRRLRKGKISKSEMKSLNVFKNYKPGEATSRLYLKNVNSKTTEQDLHYIYGRYVNWEDEGEKTMFDIRLMKEGRMKGQAFVTLGSEKRAIQAVEDTNGFELNGKPLVVQFARSAKPKEDEKDKIK